MEINRKDWDLIIKPKTSWFDVNIKELLKYKDLLTLFIKRDITANYKQTVLGPVWFFIQPIFTSVIFSVIFGNIAKLSTEGIPTFLFYMAGIICWGYFADCLNSTSSTFLSNANIFGKVYFPRLIVPISTVCSLLIRFFLQFILFILVWAYYMFYKHSSIHLTYYVLLVPLLIFQMALFGLGLGIIISSLTTKYKDFKFLVGFGVQLMMYATPIIYPLSLLKGKWQLIVLLNPMTSVIELFKLGFLGSGYFNPSSYAYSIVITIVFFVLGILTFNKVEKDFMDTI